MRVLAIVHQHDAGPGVFGDAAVEDGHGLVEWVPAEAPPPPLDGLDAAIVFGGSMDVDQDAQHPWLTPEKTVLCELLDRRTPLLGVCLGAQLLAISAGGWAAPAARPEVGWHEVQLTRAAAHDPLFAELPERFEVFSWHSYEVPLPPQGVALAYSEVCLHAYRLADRPAWGVQFHPEVTAAIVEGWLADYERAADRRDLGIDPIAIRAATAPRIEAWNQLGRALVRRFLAAATPA